MFFESESIRAEAVPAQSGVVVLRAFLTSTPDRDTIDNFGQAVRQHVERGGENVFLLHFKHISSSLHNLSMERILQLGRLIMESRRDASRIKHVIMECRKVDAAAIATAAVVKNVVEVPFLMTACGQEAQNVIGAVIKGHSRERRS
jgi:hypothetical protein